MHSKQHPNRVKRKRMQNSMITTSSATVGGLTKAFVLGFSQPTITFPQVMEVSIYAAISATIGYTIKLLFDFFKTKVRRYRIKNKKKRNEIGNEDTNETNI